MPFMIKLRWDIKAGSEADFRTQQEALCKAMHEHPGVICYHMTYPSERVSEAIEIYANDDAFAAHLANEKGKAPLGALIGASEKITCECWGNPNEKSKEILAGFGTTYHKTAGNSFELHPAADRNSRV